MESVSELFTMFGKNLTVSDWLKLGSAQSTIPSVEEKDVSVDLLGGKGFFSSIKNFKESWFPATATTLEAYEIFIVNNELSLMKRPTARVDFDDGVKINIPNQSQPSHLQFFCKTTTDGSAEACDVRLAKYADTSSIAWPSHVN